MPYPRSPALFLGGGIVPGLVGTIARAAEAVANAHGEFNPVGRQPQSGGDPYDRAGGAPAGGYDPQPCGARSGVGGSGRNPDPANPEDPPMDCMTNCELNACNSCVTPPAPRPGDPPTFGTPCEGGTCPKCCP